MILGGGHLSQFSATSSLGVNPGASNGSVVIDTTAGIGSFGLAVGDYLVQSMGALGTFQGLVTEASKLSSDPTGGTVYSYALADNRIRLQWQSVYGAWNMEDETWLQRLGRPAPPSAPGDSSDNGADGLDFEGVEVSGVIVGTGDPDDPGDTSAIRRRYWSILPEHWASGIRTWHDRPFTAREILNFAFAGALGSYGFTRHYHSALSSVILTNLDHTGGVKLASLISEINEKAGLDISLSGSRSLYWHRKGEGLAPIPDAASRDQSFGLSLTANDTRVRVVGERIRVQVCNVELEPDWQRGWEAFIDEVAWRREVEDAFPDKFTGPDTKEKQAELSAFAREVTVWQYAKKKSNPALLDGRSFGRVSRNRLPAWVYIQEIVFHSYRVPPTKTLYGIPISSLEIADTLLCATDLTGEGESTKQIYKTDPNPEFYPSTQAEAIVKGQPLDIISPRDIRLFYRHRTRDLRTEWSILNDFEVDTANFSIRFAGPVFIDGLPSEGKSLFLKLNKGEDGNNDVTALVQESSDYLDVIVPNPKCIILPAEVKVSFCVLVGPFHRDHGKGPRGGSLPVQGLGLHLLDVKGGIGGDIAGTAAFSSDDLTVPDATGNGSSFREVLYQDGGNAIAKAAAAAESITALSAVQASGGFKAVGYIPSGPSGVVDRVTVSISQAAGITGDLTYTKARPTGIALAERTLARLQRTSELFPGQEILRKEIREYRSMAAAFKGTERRSARGSTMAAALSQPVGSQHASTQILKDKNSVSPTRTIATGEVKKWLAGDIVWVDGAGVPSDTGKAFGGVLVSTPVSTGEGEEAVQTKELVVATRGVVPVRVRGPVAAGGAITANPGIHYGGASGSKAIGTLMHGEDVPVPAGDNPEVLAMVNLGAGGAPDEKIPPLTIVSSRPPYIPEPDPPPDAGFQRLHITWGLVNGVLSEDWKRVIDVPNTGDAERRVYVKAFVNTAKEENLRVIRCELNAPLDPEEVPLTPTWPTDGTRPEFVIIPLGHIQVTDGVAHIHNAGGGSIEINEHIATVASGTSGSSVYLKQFSYRRLVY